VLAESKAEQRERETSARPRVTMEELEEDKRKAADRRAADLRRETAKRLQRKQMLAAKKEQEEEERRHQVLEQRRAEIEEKRQLINAGARVRTDDVYFDDIEPAAPSYNLGEGVMRPAKPASREKPGWNSGVGPGSGPPRIGYQPASLIPPPALPPSRAMRNKSAGVLGDGSRLTTNASTASGQARRACDVHSCPVSSHNAGSVQATAVPVRKQPQQAQQQVDLDDVLARADEGIKQARLFSAAAAVDASSRPETAASSAYSIPPAAGRYGLPPHYAHTHDAHASAGLHSGRTSPSSVAPSSIYFWNNKAPCSEGGGGGGGGGGQPTADTPRSAAGGGAGGAYRRKVDALKEQIESLKRVSTAGSVASCTSTATGASPFTRALTEAVLRAARAKLHARSKYLLPLLASAL
jgi:hypothetical protein